MYIMDDTGLVLSILGLIRITNHEPSNVEMVEWPTQNQDKTIRTGAYGSKKHGCFFLFVRESMCDNDEGRNVRIQERVEVGRREEGGKNPFVGTRTFDTLFVVTINTTTQDLFIKNSFDLR